MIFKNLIYGIIIGIGFIIPGVSGGVLATILGIYDIILDKLSNFRKDIKNNIMYILPLFLGIIISILLFSKIILYLLNNQLNFISYVFIGLILGCLPFLLKEIKNKTNKFLSFKFFLLSFIFGLILFFIEHNNITNHYNPSIFIMIIAGFMYSVGKIIPGISGASLLMIIGIYEYLLNIIANPFSITFNIFISLIPFIISFILSSIIIIKMTNYLLKNHFFPTYSAIIGFVISSILFLIPNTFSFSSIIIIFCSFCISYQLSK